MTQLSLKTGMKRWKEKGLEAAKSEINQLHLRYTCNTKHYKDINKDQNNSILESYMFLKEKIDGIIKGRTVAGVNNQREFTSKEDSSSPTVPTKDFLLSCIMYEKREKGCTCNRYPPICSYR